MERKESLGIKDYVIYQDSDLYSFTADGVLLSRFGSVKKGDEVADFCAGNGIVGLHLYALKPIVKAVTLIEMQKPLFDLSIKSINENGLTNIFNAVNCKVQDLKSEYNEKFSLIVCNPPYDKADFSTINNESTAFAKSGESLSLDELVKSVSRALKFGGRFAFCYPSAFLAEAFFTLKKYNLEPKRLQLVSAKGKEPYLALIECVKGGKKGLKVLKEMEI